MAFDFYDVEGNMQPLQVPANPAICMQICISFRHTVHSDGPQNALYALLYAFSAV